MWCDAMLKRQRDFLQVELSHLNHMYEHGRRRGEATETKKKERMILEEWKRDNLDVFIIRF